MPISSSQAKDRLAIFLIFTAVLGIGALIGMISTGAVL